MFRPLSLYIGIRYTRSKRKNHFISFISGTSMIGIAVGVAVLITVLSVMNGFDEQIKDHFFSMAPQITVTDYRGPMTDWRTLSDSINKIPGVTATAPFAGKEALISYDGSNQPLMINGILPEQQSQITQINQFIKKGKLQQLTPGSFGIVIGQTLASNLHAKLGDKLTILIPQTSTSALGIGTSQVFTLVGIFDAGSGFGFDNQLGFINLKDAQSLFNYGDNITGLRIKINNVFDAAGLSSEIANQLPEFYNVTNWTEQFGSFFESLRLTKNMMFLIFVLIIAVAAFNLISSMVMVVRSKKSEIAILRTLGMRANSVLKIFMIQGMVVGTVGTTCGLIGGVLLSHHATAIVDWIQHTLHLQLVSSTIYFVDYLPSKIEWQDVFIVTVLAFVMSFLATLYPAWRAAMTKPAEALRYE